MNIQNTNKLVNDYPRIFPEPFYFECEDGWFDLIFNLCSEIDIECKRLNLEANKWTKATQIKQKYGTLRFYVNNYIDSVNQLIEKAEKQSSSICEICGLPGKTNDDYGWIRTCCKICEANSNK